MRKILGIDIGSKKLGLARLALDDDGALALTSSATIRPSADWPLERRLAYIDDELLARLGTDFGTWDAGTMAVEEPWQVVGRGKTAFAAMWRTVGHCECMANRFGMAFRLVPVADWRRTSGVKGPTRKAFKRSARRMAEVLLKKKLPEDEAEAALVARHAALTVNKQGE